MEVKNFFKFITSKRPEYTMVDAVTKGYSVPVNSGSTVDNETLSINGLFTTKNEIRNFPNIKSYKSYSDSEVEDFYYVFDVSDTRSASYLADIFGCDDYSTMIRLIKLKSGIETLSLKKRPESPYEIDNIKEIEFRHGDNIEELVLTLCKNYLSDLSDDDYEQIGSILTDSDDSLDVEDFKQSFSSGDLYNFLEYLHILSEEWCPDKIGILHDYLFDCFCSVAEYESDIYNKRFNLECDENSDYCNIERVDFKWPFVYLHLYTDGDMRSDEPEFRNQYDNITNAPSEAKEGLSYKYVAEYFEKYPIV
jgi:hypothetical protein